MTLNFEVLSIVDALQQTNKQKDTALSLPQKVKTSIFLLYTWEEVNQHTKYHTDSDRSKIRIENYLCGLLILSAALCASQICYFVRKKIHFPKLEFFVSFRTSFTEYILYSICIILILLSEYKGLRGLQTEG